MSGQKLAFSLPDYRAGGGHPLKKNPMEEVPLPPTPPFTGNEYTGPDDGWLRVSKHMIRIM